MNVFLLDNPSNVNDYPASDTVVLSPDQLKVRILYLLGYNLPTPFCGFPVEDSLVLHSWCFLCSDPLCNFCVIGKAGSFEVCQISKCSQVSQT